MTEREFATDVVRRLREAGHEALFAGGCVRDQLLGRKPDDFDVATDARPEQVQRLFRRTIAVGAAFGVVEVLGPKPHKVQVATFRNDGSYGDGRRPDSVVFSTAREDALRRDFTINGMFFDPLAGRVIDYVGGEDDLRVGVIRAIGDPFARIAEDKLRLLRAVRFATRFGYALDPATADAVRATADQVRVVSAERIAEELRKLLADPRRAFGVRLLHDVGLIGPVFPELVPTVDLPQGPPAAPTGDLWGHLVRVVELLPADASFELALAALLHDVGKRMVGVIGQRLRLATVERERVEWLVEKHQVLCDAPSMRHSTLKPLLAHRGIGELLTLHRADALASGRSVEHVEFCERCLREWPPEVLNPPPLVTGADLIALGLAPGPEFKRLLDAVRDAQLNGTVRTSAEGMELVNRMREAGQAVGSKTERNADHG